MAALSGTIGHYRALSGSVGHCRARSSPSGTGLGGSPSELPAGLSCGPPAAAFSTGDRRQRARLGSARPSPASAKPPCPPPGGCAVRLNPC